MKGPKNGLRGFYHESYFTRRKLARYKEDSWAFAHTDGGAGIKGEADIFVTMTGDAGEC